MIVNNVEKKDNGKLSFQVEVDGAAFEAAVAKAYQKAKKDIAVPGFRKGKAPRVVVEGMYGADVFYQDAVELLAPEAFEAGVTESGEKTVGAPSISDFNVGDDKALTMQFEVALYPVAELGEYKGLTVYKAPAEATDEDVAKELENVRKRNARIVVVEREAQNGDTANIDFEGFKDGVPFDGGKGEKHDLVLGSGQFVPGFEEQLVGMKTGEEKDIEVTFPENYYKELAGAKVTFKVKVNEVKETQLPELDDEFAKDVSEYDTLDEYKAGVKTELSGKKAEESEKDFRNDAVKKACDNVTVTIPDVMVDERVDTVVSDYARNCSAQGMTLDQYLGMMGMNEESFRRVLRPSAENEVKTELMLETIAEAEAFEISDEDIDAEYKKAAEQYGMEVEDIKKSVDTALLTRELKLRKAAELVCDSAVVTDVPEEKEETKADEPAEAE